MTISNERMYVVLNEMFFPPKSFSDDTITFGKPRVVDKHNRNTVVQVRGIPGKGYYGEVDVYYNRLDLSGAIGHFFYRTNIGFTIENIVDAILSRTGIDFKVDDLAHFDIIDVPDKETLSVSLSVNPESLQWIGELDITLTNDIPDLGTIVGRKSLGIFRHPNPDYDKLYGRLLGWNVDFTGVLDIIGPSEDGGYIDWTSVNLLTTALGWPSWSEGGLVDKSTADVPGSNPNFDRVIIQSEGVSESLEMPIFFHYNKISGYK